MVWTRGLRRGIGLSIVAGVTMLHMQGAQAFDFSVDAAGNVVNARFASLDQPTRAFLRECSKAGDGGRVCDFQVGAGVAILAHQPADAIGADWVGIVMEKQSTQMKTFAATLVTLMTLCSPNATEAQRDDLMRTLAQPLERTSASFPDTSADLPGAHYTLADRPNAGILLRIDQTAP